MSRTPAIGQKYNIPIIEDAAEAIGSIYHRKRAGTMGKFGAFSFHGTKTITTGEGGMFVTSDAALYETVLTLSNHGRAPGRSNQFSPDTVGFSQKMSKYSGSYRRWEMQAHRRDLVTRKREILRRYRHAIEPMAGVRMNLEPQDTINGAWMPTAVFGEETGVTREKAAVCIQTGEHRRPGSSSTRFPACPVFEDRDCKPTSQYRTSRAVLSTAASFFTTLHRPTRIVWRANSSKNP